MKWKLYSRTTAVVGSLLVLAACSGTDVTLQADQEPVAVDRSITPEPAPAEAPVVEEAPHWSYTGVDGPENWGELAPQFATCAVGTHQSPIDLAPAVYGDVPPIEFSYAPAPVTILNNGHTVQVDYPEGSSISLGGVRYQVAQYHFHAPSEHTIGGVSYPAELHIVHANDAGELAVVGILLTEGAANAALEPVLANLPVTTAPPVDLGLTVDAADFLPVDHTSYRYNGSLTTPPCTEGVNWIVMSTPVEVSADQIARLNAVLAGNSRPVQAVNDRTPLEDGTA